MRKVAPHPDTVYGDSWGWCTWPIQTRRCFEAHATLAIAQEQLMIALMRVFAARAELHRGIDDNRTHAIQFGRDRLVGKAHDLDEAYEVARNARQAWLDVVERRMTREERQVLVLREPQWWLERPDVLRDALALAQARDVAGHPDEGTISVGDGRAEVRSDRRGDELAGAGASAEIVVVSHPGWWLHHMDEMTASLERALEPERGLRDLLDNAPPPEDRSRDSGRE